MSPTEPFTEVHLSPHHWPDSKIYTSQDISKNQGKVAKKTPHFWSQVFCRIWETRGANPLFLRGRSFSPPRVCDLQFTVAIDYQAFLAKLHSQICTWGPHTLRNQDCVSDRSRLFFSCVFFIHWHTPVGVRIGAGMAGVGGNDELLWLHPPINWVHTNKNCAWLFGWVDMQILEFCTKKKKGILKDQSMEF